MLFAYALFLLPRNSCYPAVHGYSPRYTTANCCQQSTAKASPTCSPRRLTTGRSVYGFRTKLVGKQWSSYIAAGAKSLLRPSKSTSLLRRVDHNRSRRNTTHVILCVARRCQQQHESLAFPSRTWFACLANGGLSCRKRVSSTIYMWNQKRNPIIVVAGQLFLYAITEIWYCVQNVCLIQTNTLFVVLKFDI